MMVINKQKKNKCEKKNKNGFIWAKRYCKIDYVMYAAFIVFLVLFVCAFALAIVATIFSDKCEKISNLAVISIIAFFSVAIIALVVSYLFAGFRKKAMQAFTEYSFNRYMHEIGKISSEVKKLSEKRFFEIFIYSMWEYVNNDLSLKRFLFMDAIEDKDIEELERDKLIIVSLLRCLTYTRDDRVFRIPSIYTDSKTLYEIFDSYNKIYGNKKNNNVSKNSLWVDLKEIEDKYSESKKSAKEKWSVLSSPGGGIKEVFCSTTNNEGQLSVIKKMCAIAGLVLFILDIIIDSPEWDKNIAIFFEAISVFLLFADISKDKDLDYLH